MMTNRQTPQPPTLDTLLAGLVEDCPAVVVSGLQLDSRAVIAGDLFLAAAGESADGRDYIAQAAANGAVAVLAEAEGFAPYAAADYGLPVLVCSKLSQQLSLIAARFYAAPDAGSVKTLPLFAVTGTNGKTSCSQLMMQLLNKLDRSCGLIGTLGTGVDGAIAAGINTTPDAISIQRLIAQWREQAVDAVAMEVSSHGLQQGRVAALAFSVAVFTNLSRDHLDYHGDMQCYGEAKLALFRQPGLEQAVINADDKFSDVVAQTVAADVKVLRYSIAADSDADIRVGDVRYHGAGVTAVLHSPWGDYPLSSPLLGHFNLSNALAALATLATAGYPLADLLAALAAVEAVPGRMERVESQADIEVVVDYAHSPDALAQALSALRRHCDGRLHCLFGCGGDRDRGKRPQMAAIAEQLADRVVITSDNPRGEAAATIVGDIVSGLNDAALAVVELDRASAIARVIAEAKTGDMVLLAGKGHEDYQQIGERRLPFNDFVQARLALAARVDGGVS